MTQKVRRHSEQSEEFSYFFYFDSRLNWILHIRSGRLLRFGSYRLRLQDDCFGMDWALVVYSVKMVKISYFT